MCIKNTKADKVEDDAKKKKKQPKDEEDEGEEDKEDEHQKKKRKTKKAFNRRGRLAQAFQSIAFQSNFQCDFQM